MIKPEKYFAQRLKELKMKLYDLKSVLYDYRNNAIMKGKTGLLGSDIHSLIIGYLDKAMYMIDPLFLEKYKDKITSKELEKVISNFEMYRHRGGKDIDSFDLASILMFSITTSNIIEDKDDKNALAIISAFIVLDPPFVNIKGVNLRMSNGPYFDDMERVDLSQYDLLKEYLNNISLKEIECTNGMMFSDIIYQYYMNKVTNDHKIIEIDRYNVKIKKKIKILLIEYFFCDIVVKTFANLIHIFLMTT